MSNWHTLSTLFREGWREPLTWAGVALGGVVVWLFDADAIRQAGERMDALAFTAGKAGAGVAAVALILRRQGGGDA